MAEQWIAKALAAARDELRDLLPTAISAIARGWRNGSGGLRGASTSMSADDGKNRIEIEQAAARNAGLDRAATADATADRDRSTDEHPVDSGSADADTGSEARPHPFRGLWLERRVSADTTLNPFGSILDFPDEEAARIAEEMGKRVDGDYVTIRKAAEAWLRSHNTSNRDSTEPAVYFKLVKEPGTYPFSEKSATICIPADSIPAEHMTITIEDSFFHYQMVSGNPPGNTPEGFVPGVISGDELYGAVDFDGEHRDYRGTLAGGNGRYIEAQVWNRDVPVLAEVRRRFETGLPADRLLIVEPGSWEG